MVDAFRVSLVRMYYATNPKRSATPTPFCELRAFLFLKGIPTAVLRRRLQILLNEELNKLEDIIESVGEQKRAGTIAEWRDSRIRPDAELIRPTPISMKPPTRQVKVMIEGLEVQRMDIQEVFGAGANRYFSQNTEDRVMLSKRDFLNLQLNKPQRYFALFENSGDIRFEYDEADISSRLIPLQIAQRRIVEARQDLINALVGVKKEVNFQDSIVDIMRLVERQRQLRG